MFKGNNKDFAPFSSASIVKFEHVIAGWVVDPIFKNISPWSSFGGYTV